jgi:CheY-like chemotaxis protein
MAKRSAKRFLDDLRRLADACQTVERRLQEDASNVDHVDGRHGASATDNDESAGGDSDSLVLSDLIPEAHHLCALARELRECCGHVTASLHSDTSGVAELEPRRHTILAVDDIADTRELLTVILEQAGFEVVTASNGLEALIAAHRTRPSLILMDVQMPILDGIEATRLLKATDATKHIPVIAHTARPGSCHVPPGVLFAHILPKPVIPDVLLALTHRFVPNGHGAG